MRKTIIDKSYLAMLMEESFMKGKNETNNLDFREWMIEKIEELK